MAFFARYRCDLVLISCYSKGPCRPVANTIGMSLGRWVESGQRELFTEWYSAQGLQGLDGRFEASLVVRWLDRESFRC